MRIPKYWTWATADGCGAYGWSDASVEEARRCGEERARRIAAAKAGEGGGQGEYPYPDRPVREEVIERDEAAGWVITRNSYGALVLNAAEAMFVDIDLPATGGGVFGRLFGKKKPDPGQAIIEQTRQVIGGMSGMGARLYRTAGGFRVLITSETYDPTGDLAHDLLGAFGSDERYAALCRMQACFRARLTPKPWRCNVRRPPVRFPFHDEAQAQKQAAWLSEYERARGRFGVCELVESLGNLLVVPQVEPVLRLHDQHACANAGGPLA